MSIGSNIKDKRKKAGYSQVELATKLGVSDKTISSWEIDRTEPNIGMIEKLCVVLECKKSALIGTNITDNEERALELFCELTPDQQESIINLMKSMK